MVESSDGYGERTCHYCRKTLTWLWHGERLKDGSKIYLDAAGNRWSGRRCPECERSRVKKAIRCDAFERQNILTSLQNEGYELVSSKLPLKVRKDGKIYEVAIRRAFTKNGEIVIEDPPTDENQVVALIFESVRLCTSDQMKQLQPHLTTFDRINSPPRQVVDMDTSPLSH